MRRTASIALLLALIIPSLGFRGCNDSSLTPAQKTTARKVHDADNYLNEGVRAGINTKRTLKGAGKITTEESLAAGEALLKLQDAVDEFHEKTKTLTPDSQITDETIAEWIHPVVTASQALKGLAFKSSEAKAAFDTAAASVDAGVSIYLSLKGSFKR